MKRGKKTVAILALLIATVANSYAAGACEKPINVTVKDGRQIAYFDVGDSRCRLFNDQIHCTPASQ